MENKININGIKEQLSQKATPENIRLEPLEQSFKEKLSEVTNLALQIDNFLYKNNLYEFFDQDIIEKVDGYARGLKQERIMRQLLELDIAKEEQKIDDDIILLKETLKNLI